MSADRGTYSFRASPKLADRLVHARAALLGPTIGASDVDSWTAREVEMGVARLRRRAVELADDSDAFMRATIELVIDAIEKVSASPALEADLRAWEREDVEGGAFRRGALRASVPVWRDG